MKILWVINAVLPRIADACSIKSGVSGGWLTGISESLAANDSVDLAVCFPYDSEDLCGDADGIRFYSFKSKGWYKYSKATERRFREIIETFRPDIIHVFGTEFPHSLAVMNAALYCGLIDKTIVSIQGLVSVIAEHYYANLPLSAVYAVTLRDIIRRDNIARQRKKFIKRGKFETETIRLAKHVIGRTDWDEACVKLINDKVDYNFCNETLRSVFYSDNWEYDNCEKYSIFVGSGAYTIKGLHCIIDVFPIILRKYPDAKIYVPGESPFELQGLKGLIHKTYYNIYLKKIIKRNKLKEKIVFLGGLSATQMKERMLKSNVFVLTSSIENSPNTLGEAMLLGVPCVASDVGGVRNMATDKLDALIYPFEESYLIPFYIGKIFDDPVYAEKLSMASRKRAAITHSRIENNRQLLGIYKKIIKS